ncbi:chain length determinant protein EpsF [Glaciimonas sp. CA11.2]|uniref:chain length determinant protein EpsF n=1 Tax=unclassified Glaciimonas TaxID=2644401 RepID=UPI002AB5D10B|nr:MULTISPECIES: chain length determinant protein EpsF [unclassified Glaciimonas]MDY7548964.1 chain length determinant protein EpsF [Glaciimonas sp. CA11.2]MEB0013663.1 chain length determinant protein EpsF [Glaciimonas sp. Cout2]MEB0083689.1 chain length determinant protein EpsF [Glaciimonas sp. Gout2]MEB0163687.1 chain length determinant protein EpsF [Glaciimonas sp. CA11.2]
MTFYQLLTILRARYKIVLYTLILIVAATTLVSLFLPKTYKASSTMLLNYKGTDPVSGEVLPAQLVAGYMATQMDIVISRSVALKAVDNLGLANDPVFKQRFADSTKGEETIRDWLADMLLKMVDVSPARESSVVEINAKGKDPRFAAAIANGFANAYQQVNLEIKVAPMRQAATYFTGQIKSLRVDLEAAQSKLSAYQQEHGLVSTDNHLDVETARLNDLSSQLVAAQGQAIEASSRANQAMGSGGRDSPDVIANSLIQTLKSSLALAEGKFAQLSKNLAPNHPQYQAAKAEVDRLRAELNSNISATNNGSANNGRILRQREAEVRAALATQTAKVLQLNRARDGLSVLVKDVDNAQRAYDAVNLRLTKSELEGNSNQSDVSLLNAATTPVRPASPNIPLNIVLSVMMGLMLGFALAILQELAHRRVRSDSDAAKALSAPVLGTINWGSAGPKKVASANRLVSSRAKPEIKG